MSYRIADVREYLTKKFNDEELEILCTDYFPDVLDNFTSSMTKDHKVQLLIRHCRERDAMLHLLQAVQERRPGQFAAWVSQLPERDRPGQYSRRELLTRIRNLWTKKDPKGALPGADPVSVRMEDREDLIRNPRHLDRRPPERSYEMLPEGETIESVFLERANKVLLMLGERGAGKKTLLFELKDALVDRAAAAHKDAPIPVIVPLSTWSGDQQNGRYTNADDFKNWLIARLSRLLTSLDRDTFPAWIEAQSLFLLLYGLEQVKPVHQETCVEAINDFVSAYGCAGIVVCSDTQAYVDLPARFEFQGAVELQPLTPQQIYDYLASSGDAQMASLGALLRGNEEKLEAARVTLRDLGVMIAEHRARPVATPHELNRLYAALEADRKAQYDDNDLERMFKDELDGDAQFKAHAVRWLTWLAQKMAAHGEVPFYVERMQPDWLPTRNQRRLHTLLTGLAVWLLVGGVAWWAVYLMMGVFFGPNISRLDRELYLFYVRIVGPLFGLVAGLAVWLAARRLSGYRSAVGLGLGLGLAMGAAIWRDFQTSPLLALLGGCAVGLVAGAVFFVFLQVLVSNLGASRRPIEMVNLKNWTWSKAPLGLFLGASVGVALWLALDVSRALFFELPLKDVWSLKSPVWELFGRPVTIGMGLLGMLMVGLRAGTVKIDEQVAPNQGLRSSGKQALLVGVLGALAVGLPFVLAHWPAFLRAVGLPPSRYGEVFSRPLGGLAIGLLTGLFGGLIFGGFAWLQHIFLRLLLYLGAGHIPPWRYTRFFRYAIRREFLEESGGGYDFRSPWRDFFEKRLT